jgi:hypothetical protein
MKNTLFIGIRKSVMNRHTPLAPLVAALLVAAAPAGQLAAQETNAAAAKAEKPPPLPLHRIEGNGGIFSTLSAYLVNPPRDGEAIGRPAAGFAYINLGHGQNLEAFTVTETPWKRLELGFGYDNFSLGDLPTAIVAQGGPWIDSSVALYNVNARLQLLKEGEFDQKWIPALTTGVHYKNNVGISEINQRLGGALNSIGIVDHQGVDVTLYASKMLTFLPRPVLLEAGGRATKGVWNGLAGFSENYSFLFEGNVVVFVTDRLLLAAEFKQMPNDYTPTALIHSSGNWWTLDAAYIVNPHLTVAVGYGHFGGVLNQYDNAVWGITTKWEF